MIILHATFYENSFYLWGEIPVEHNSVPAKRRGGKESSYPGEFPYDAGVKQLSSALKNAGTGFKPRKKDSKKIIAWLPTIRNKAVASSPIIDDPPVGRPKPVIAPWQVTTFCLPVDRMLEILCACVGREALATGVIAGKDMKFWTTAMRFAGSLVARQQFLPGLARENGNYRAIWEPVFTGTDAGMLAKLAKSMPHVCRALTIDSGSPPAKSPLPALNDFIDKTVDHLVRSAMLKTPLEGSKGFDTVHDQWIYALRSVDGTMEGGKKELETFYAQVSDWKRSLPVSSAAPFRLCFRLEEPGASEDIERKPISKRKTWSVGYFLQSSSDQSLLISARDAWRKRGRAASILSRGGFKSHEHLLTSLGHASAICPRIEESLKTSEPEGYPLDTDNAYDFLTEKALLLEQAGFGVMLPAWWTRKGTKLRLSAHVNVKSPKMQGGSGISLDEIVKFDWEVALGDEKLSFSELEALARLKTPLVNVRGQWVQMRADEIREAVDFWKKNKKGSASVREIVHMSLGATKDVSSIDFKGVKAQGWVSELLAQLEGNAKFENLKAPDEFHGTLRPYQMRGYSWLGFLRRWGLGACLADDMGLGKTIQMLALIQRDWHLNGKRPVLLVCPTSVVGNWQKEAARFTPKLPVMVHHGIGRSKGAAFKEEAKKHAMVVSSYSLLHRDFEILNKVRWQGVVLDEAQNIKNPETRQARAARSLDADYRVALTGTPVENNVGDLWSIMEFLNPGFLGTQTEFKKRFFNPIQASRDPDAVNDLKRLTKPFILRRLKTDKSIISDLPEKMEMKVFCTLTKEQASLYAAVTREAERALDKTESIQRKGIVLATLSKLKQVCNHPAQFLGDNSAIPGRSGKLARITEMIEEILEVGEKTLVFTQFSEMGKILKRHLQETFGREALFLHGAVPKKKRDTMIERFQENDGGPQIFILSLKAGGTGLNLTEANHVFHFDRWWNPAVEDQATDRAFRIGQTKNVQVHKFLCVGTLEEKIDEMIERKKKIAGGIVGTGEKWLTELSTGELKELFALRKEAVGE